MRRLKLNHDQAELAIERLSWAMGDAMESGRNAVGEEILERLDSIEPHRQTIGELLDSRTTGNVDLVARFASEYRDDMKHGAAVAAKAVEKVKQGDRDWWTRDSEEESIEEAQREADRYKREGQLAEEICQAVGRV